MIMQISLEKNSANNQIRSYEPGEIKVNETVYKKSIMLTPDTLTEWAPQSLAELTLEHLTAMILLKPQVILLGTGAKLIFPTAAINHAVLSKGIGFEVMDTRAACRTFNILTAEDRKVIAALIIR